ncbi:MAG: pyrimidine 5'-nucleotidase [Pseudomonadota bacterium]
MPPLKTPYECGTWLVDLDNTLYAPATGIMTEIRRRIGLVMGEILGVSDEQVHQIRRRYAHRYGTSLRGLMHEHEGVDPYAFLQKVHDFELGLSPDPALRAALQAYPGRKIIFTNSDRDHARRVLQMLGIEDMFAGMIDIIDQNFIPKPQPASYQLAIDRYDLDPADTLMIDDTPDNLRTAGTLGMTTVLAYPGQGGPPALPNLPDPPDPPAPRSPFQPDYLAYNLTAWLEDQRNA